MEKQPTKRDIASAAKRALIFDKALELFKEKGYQNTKMTDICEATGLSIGSIYHFYKGKGDILLQISKQMRRSGVLAENIEENARRPYRSLVRYLSDYARRWEKLGVDLTTQIYLNFGEFYLDPEDVAQRHIESYSELGAFIAAAQGQGTFDRGVAPEEAARWIMMVGRGLVYDWCLHNGSYSLTADTRRFMPYMLGRFVDMEEEN